MIVRPATIEDMPSIIAMARAFHGESPVFRDQPFDEIQVHNLVSEAIPNPDWLAVVVYGGGELVGMGLFFALPSFFGPSIEVGDLAFFVRPDRRGGVAAAGIMEALLHWARTKEAYCVDLGVNTGINTAKAAEFFEHCGFKAKGPTFRMVL